MTAEEGKSKVYTFLAAYGEHANVGKAAEIAGISKATHYKRLATDKAYAKAFEATRKRLGGELFDNTYKRARDGWLEPVYYKGKIAGYIRRFSEGRELALLRGLMREVMSEHVEHNHTGSIEIVERLIAGRERLAKHASNGS